MERIVVASHVTPCGRSWVDNLLLLLSVKWSYTDLFDDWVHIWKYDAAEGTYQHRHSDNPQRFVKRYCAAMQARDVFRFRPGMEAISTHSYPRTEWRNCKKIYVARDFRHALISAFGRPMPGRRFADFIAELDPDLMVPIYYGLQYHAESWLRQSRLHLVRQEDYRLDPEREVARLAGFLGIDLAARELRAIAAASVSYVPQPTVVDDGWREDIALMEERCRGTLRKLGYAHEADPGRPADLAPPPRQFIHFAIEAGLYPGVELWDGADDADLPAPAPQAGNGHALGAYLSPLTDALANLKARGTQRMIYGQPVGPAWKRGSKADTSRFVRNAAALLKALSDGVLKELAEQTGAPPARAPYFVEAVSRFERGSAATAFDAAGFLVAVADDAPRHAFAPEDGRYLGIMIESAGENLLRESTRFAGAAWAFDGLAASEVCRDEPPFRQFARLRSSAAACRPSLVQGVLLREQNAPHTFSVYAKPGSLKDLVLQFSHGRAWCSAYFDVAAGLAYRTAANRGAAVGRTGASRLRNGWVRLEASFAFDCEIEQVNCRIYLAQDTGALDFAAGEPGELFLFGAQLELGTVASSYVETAAAPAARHDERIG